MSGPATMPLAGGGGGGPPPPPPPSPPPSAPPPPPICSSTRPNSSYVMPFFQGRVGTARHITRRHLASTLHIVRRYAHPPDRLLGGLVQQPLGVHVCYSAAWRAVIGYSAAWRAVIGYRRVAGRDRLLGRVAGRDRLLGHVAGSDRCERPTLSSAARSSSHLKSTYPAVVAPAPHTFL